MSLPASMDAANDEILGLFRTYWNANSPALNGGQAPLVQWPGPVSEPADNTAPFARIRLRYGTSIQRTFGPAGTRRFERPGFVTVQTFGPLSKGDGLILSQNLGIIARDAYEGRGTSSGIWFRNARLTDSGEDGSWHIHTMITEFTYEELR